MHRRRSALTVSTAAAFVIAAPLLTACGNDARPGAAAVVDGDRITMSQLQSQVGAVRDAQSAQPQGDELIKRTGTLTKDTLDDMIRYRVVQRVAKDSGITVSRRDVQQTRELLETQFGGAKEFKQMLLMQNVAPSGIDDLMWLEAATQKIAAASGIDTQAPNARELVDRKLAEESKGMSIDVNPRYGKWDSKRGMRADSGTPWLKDVTGEQKDKQQQRPEQPA